MKRLRQATRQVTLYHAPKRIADICGQRINALLPGRTGTSAAQTRQAPCVYNPLGYHKRGVPPLQLLARGGGFLFSQGRPVTSSRILLARRAVTDNRPTRHKTRLVRLDSFSDGSFDCFGIMPVNTHNMPARRFKTPTDVGTVRQRSLAINGNAIVVPQNNQAAEF